MVTKAAFRAARPGRNSELGDRDLKREGYGVLRVDKANREFVIECWPWDAGEAGEQFPGWPYRLKFSDA
jgi:alkaline phosphatase D